MNHTDIEDTLITSSTDIIPKSLGRLLEFYISGAITSADNYVKVFDSIRHASENDVVKLYINSCGGDMFTAIQFMRVLAETDASVVVSVEGACMSAATLLLLCVDSVEVTPHSVFMFHNYSGGTFGKGGEMYSQISHERKWSEKLLREIYEDFLTADEITSLLDNKDLWLDVDEVVERMESRIKAKEATKE